MIEILFEIPEAETIKPGELSNSMRVLSRVDLLPTRLSSKCISFANSFLQVLVMKTSIGLFFSNEHEMNLNKRRRQLQSPVLGVLVFLWRNFLDFWFFVPSSWQLILQTSQDIARLFKIVEKNARKVLGFFQDKQKDPRSSQKKQESLASKYYTIILVLVKIYTKFATFNRFWWINYFFRKPIFFPKLLNLFDRFEKSH